MRNRLYKTAIPWTLFAAAFLVPHLFLLFIPFAAITAIRVFVDEYGEIFVYWKERFRLSLRLRKRGCLPKIEPSPLKAAAEMV